MVLGGGGLGTYIHWYSKFCIQSWPSREKHSTHIVLVVVKELWQLKIERIMQIMEFNFLIILEDTVTKQMYHILFIVINGTSD